MPAFYILLILCAAMTVLSLAPYYKKIGGFFKDMFTTAQNAVHEDDEEDGPSDNDSNE